MDPEKCPVVTRRELLSYDAFYVLDHFLGRRVVDALLGDVRRRRREAFLARLEGRRGVRRSVDRVRDLSPAEFVRRYLRTGTPVVFAGAARDWPCVERWSLKFFAERHGGQPIVVLPTARTTSGFAGTRDDETSRTTTFAEVIGGMTQGDAPYIRFSTVVEDHDDLRADLSMPWIEARLGPLPLGYRIHTFIGAAGSRTRLHSDFPPNLFVQVHGRKHWLLYPPAARAVIDPLLERSALSFTCNFEVRAPDVDDDALCHHLDGFECELEPGDVLFNPAYMWHDVLNRADSIGVSVRWLSPGIHLRASWVMQLLNLFAVNPPVWRAGLQKRDFNAELLASKNAAKARDPHYRG